MTAVTGATSATSWANQIYDEYLDPLIADYQHEFVSVTPAARFIDLRGKNSAVAGLNRHVSDFASVAAIAEASPSTGLVAVESTMATKVSITAAKYGIKRQPSVELFQLQGEAETRDYLARDAATLLALYLEDAIMSLFTGATPNVTHTGQDNSLIYHLEAAGTLRALNAPPPYFACYDNVAFDDLKVSTVASGGAILGNPTLNIAPLVRTTVPGTPIDIFGVNTVDSTLCDDSSSDAISGMFVDARVSLQHAGLAYALLMEPRTMAADDPDTLTVKVTFYQSTGCAIQNVLGICKILTANS